MKLTPLLLVLFAGNVGQAQTVTVSGFVRDSATRSGVPGATVIVVGTTLGARAGPDGAFHIASVQPGIVTIRARMLGFRPADLQVTTDSLRTPVEIRLSALAVKLAEIVVSPGRFTLLEAPLAQTATLSREDIQTMPQIGEDIYRAVNRLPGMASNEMSAKFWVRGGNDGEMLVRIDGLEIHEPFHLKDFDGALSIVDVQSVTGVELLTGGFPADYGNRLTGVFNLETGRDTVVGIHGSAGITLGSARVAGRGGFAKGRGRWMASARRGYIDVLLDVFNLLDEDEELVPRYYDGLGALQYQFSDRHSASLNVLTADDRTTFRSADTPTLRSGYVSSYAWATLRSAWSPRVSSETVASAGRLSWRRQGAGLRNPVDSLLVDDRRAFSFAGFKQDWSITLADRHVLRFGGEAKVMDSEYRYLSWHDERTIASGAVVSRTDWAQASLDPNGSMLGGFAAYRVQPLPAVTVELGARADRQSWAPGWNAAPRATVAWSVGRGATLRGAWGWYFQPQQLFQLDVHSDDAAFYPAELAEHRVVGIEKAFGDGTGVTVEAYQRRLSRYRPRTLSIENDVEVYFDTRTDRIRVTPTRGEARGVELFVRRRGGAKWDWSLNYSLAEVWDEIGGRKVPRFLDQQHTAYVEVGYRPTRRWSFSWAWQFHTGWPHTPVTFELVPLAGGGQGIIGRYGQLNSVRLPAYHRMDIRASHRFPAWRGQLLVYLDVFNVYNRDNPRAYFYNVNVVNGNLVPTREVDSLLPILPTFGLSLEF